MKNHYLNVSVCALITLLFAACAKINPPVNELYRFNQLGFYPSEEKIAVLDTVVSGPFYIKELNSGKVVYEGLVSQPRLSAFSEKETVVIPFSQLRTKGTYFIEIPEVGKSLPFEIKDSLFFIPVQSITQGFLFTTFGYGNRSGICRKMGETSRSS